MLFLTIDEGARTCAKQLHTHTNTQTRTRKAKRLKVRYCGQVTTNSV